MTLAEVLALICIILIWTVIGRWLVSLKRGSLIWAVVVIFGCHAATIVALLLTQ